jgi:hypothetical protein
MQLDPLRGYDLIGDVHGCGHALEQLLDSLGYRPHAGVWRHPQRMALFLGDIIDRGPRIRESLHLVHDMLEAGQAMCIMGNHEFNALAWNSLQQTGADQPQHQRYPRQLQQTLLQFEAHPGDWRDFLAWFHELPLFIDAGHFRMVHACWDALQIGALRHAYPDGRIDAGFVAAATRAGSEAQGICERLLRGQSMPLPDGMTLTSEDGFTRRRFRTKFWEEDPRTYGDIVFQPDALPGEVAAQQLSLAEKAALLRYADSEPLLFVGHYWQRGRPAPLRPNLACLDYSAVMRGKLVAYRLDQESRLDPHKFVWVEVEQQEAPQ